MFTVVIEHSVTLEAFPDVIREKTNAEGGRGRWGGGGGTLRADERARDREREREREGGGEGGREA